MQIDDLQVVQMREVLWEENSVGGVISKQTMLAKTT